jgi:hypothetical protein
MSINECNRLLEQYSSKQDIGKNFFEFVYKKISRDTKNRFVSRDDNSIDIIPFESSPVKVIPLNKEMDSSKLDLGKEMDMARNIIQGDGVIKQVYFVYPKNDNFKKHISVKLKELEDDQEEYAIKVIPYSLESLTRTRNKKSCCGACSGCGSSTD